MEAKKVSSAQSKLNQVGSDFNLDPRRDAEYADFIEVYGILFEKIANSINTLTESEEIILEEIAFKNSTVAAGLALTVLNEYSDYDYLEVLVEPDWQGKTNRVVARKKVNTESQYRIYPNPTRGLLFLQIPNLSGGYGVDVFDSSGRKIRSERVNMETNAVDLRELTNGSYIIVLQDADGSNLAKWNIVKTN